jgi:uncharacterized membrane protein
MEFTFSIRTALRDAWHLYKAHWKFFVGTALVSVAFNLLGGDKTPWWVQLVLGVAAFIWSIIMMKISLAAADKKEEMLSFHKIKDYVPTWQQALGLIGVGIMSALIILGGLVLLIIPGIYFAFRLGVANLSFIDKNEGVFAALRRSWDMTKGSPFWTIVLVALVSVGLYIVGLVLFGIGILVTYPLALILMAKLYRALGAHFEGTHTVVPQPVEIPAHTETPAPQEETKTEEVSQ